MTPTLPLESGDIRTAVVLSRGAGNPPAKTLTIQIDGVDGPTIILAPPKGVPAVRATVTVRRQQGHGGGTYWSLA